MLGLRLVRLWILVSSFSLILHFLLTRAISDGKLAARRKFELIDPTVYSIINYNEADAVLDEWSSLADSAQSMYDRLGSAAQPAFFELVLQPVLSGGVVNRIHIGAARNQLFVEQKRNSANDVAQGVLADFSQDANLTSTFHKLLDGKWK